MGYNTFETIDNTFRGEPYGQMTPEGQKLWDEYQSLLGAQKNAPMRNLRLRSGNTMQIVDPGFGLKNRMLSKTLGGMTGTGMGTRAAAQPGLFSQLAPLFIAAGIKDPKQMARMMEAFGIKEGGASESAPAPTGGGGLDWGSGLDLDFGGDFASNFDAGDIMDTGGEWGWLD